MQERFDKKFKDENGVYHFSQGDELLAFISDELARERKSIKHTLISSSRLDLTNGQVAILSELIISPEGKSTEEERCTCHTNGRTVCKKDCRVCNVVEDPGKKKVAP